MLPIYLPSSSDLPTVISDLPTVVLDLPTIVSDLPTNAGSFGHFHIFRFLAEAHWPGFSSQDPLAQAPLTPSGFFSFLFHHICDGIV